MSDAPAAVVILISGRGSNLQAILDETQAGRLPIRVSTVISNNPDADGLRHARAAGVPTETIDHRAFSERALFESALMQAIDRHTPRLVLLAGFMRILGDNFIHHYSGRLLNIHPSLLPEFKGMNTHARAIAAGVRLHGASVHFVTNDLDGGPVIVQASVPIRADDNAATLGARVLTEEHRIFPLAVRWYVEGRLTIRDGRVLLDGETRPEQALVTESGQRAQAAK